MKLKAALLIFLVIFTATATSLVFKASNRQTNEMTVDDSIVHHRVLQIGNETPIDQLPIDCPGGPG